VHDNLVILRSGDEAAEVGLCGEDTGGVVALDAKDGAAGIHVPDADSLKFTVSY
jgi:hypothetical protein